MVENVDGEKTSGISKHETAVKRKKRLSMSKRAAIKEVKHRNS